MDPRFGDLKQRRQICFQYQVETFGKISLLILVRRIRALIWVNWVESDTWADLDFWVIFYVTVFPTDSVETLQILNFNTKRKQK